MRCRLRVDVRKEAIEEQGRQRAQLLVAGGDGTNQRRSAAENVVLSGGVERIGSGAVAEEHRGLQRAGAGGAAEAVPGRAASAGGRPAGGARSGAPSAAGENAAVWRLLPGVGVMAAAGTGSVL